MADILLEVCVDDIAGLEAAVEGGADRIELCSALSAGGLTPSAGLMGRAADMDVPVYAMIRPRTGDFIYTPAELDVMARDIEAARAAGLEGVVFGANLPDGRLDKAALSFLCERAGDMPKTLHRAFDLVSDIEEAVEIAVRLGFERILTSGGQKTAAGGIEGLQRTFTAAAGRIAVMPGSGINTETVAALLDAAPFREIHASCAAPLPASADLTGKVLGFGFALAGEKRSDAERVRALKALLAAHPASAVIR